MNVGLLGGTFDPPHLAHLQAADVALDVLGLDVVWFLLAGNPPHKPAWKLTPADVRRAMVEAAIADEPRFRLCLHELNSPGPHYTYLTLEALTTEHPDYSFTLLIGSDSLTNLPLWRQPERIRELVKLAVFERPDYPLAAISPDLLRGVTVLPVFPLPISSSVIRERIASGKSVRRLVPPSVLELIGKYDLYR